MSSREEIPRRWPAEPESGSASGGHVTPDASSTAPLLDPLSAPLPSEVERARQAADPARGDRPRPGTERRPARRVRPGIRRVKRTIRHVDPISVLKLSLFYYGCFVVVLLILTAVLYAVLNSLGFFDTLVNVGEGLVIPSLENSEIDLMWMERWALIIGLTMAVVGSLLNAFLAFLYNIGADLVGGVEVTFVEKDV